jgi:large subunit ribosomal protein L4
MINAPHYSAAGVKRADGFALPAGLFDGTVNEDVLHQAVKSFLGNQRQGTHKVKTRAEVSGGGRKPYKQKGTGRARQGSNRAPHWRGGGVAFGPSPRSYRTELPKKVRQLARRSALNARAREGMLHVIDTIAFTAPKTQELLGLLGKLALDGVKTLILTNGSKPPVYLSARNVPHLTVLPFADASAYDILRADALVIEGEAFGGEPMVDEAEEAPKPKKKAAAKKTAPKTESE